MAKKGMGLGRGFDTLIPTILVEEEFDPTRKEDEKLSQRIVNVSKIRRSPVR